MAGITNLAKGAAKNIAQALSTDGVGKALAKRAAVYGGFGAVGGGTLSAIQGGSFGEGAVRGGILGAGVGAATGAYKMGAFGNSVLDEAGHFRKGATSVYSHVASGNATWAQVNQYRQQDINAFMGHMRDAQDADDLAARFRQMDGASKKKYQKPIINEVPVQGPPKPPVQGASKSSAKKIADINLATDNNGQVFFADVLGSQAATSESLVKKKYAKPAIGYVQGPPTNTQKYYNDFTNSITARKNGRNILNRIEGEGSKIAKGLYNTNNLSTEQLSEGIYRYFNSSEGQKFLARHKNVQRSYNTFLNALTS